MMMSERKVVINRCYGGFGLSEAGMLRYAEKKGVTLYPEKGRFGLTTYFTTPPDARPVLLADDAWLSASQEERIASNAAHKQSTIYDKDIERDDPALVATVEELGDGANGQYARLSIVEIPADVRWEIDEYDGSETIREAHRSWS